MWLISHSKEFGFLYGCRQGFAETRLSYASAFLYAFDCWSLNVFFWFWNSSLPPQHKVELVCIARRCKWPSLPKGVDHRTNCPKKDTSDWLQMATNNRQWDEHKETLWWIPHKKNKKQGIQMNILELSSFQEQDNAKICQVQVKMYRHFNILSIVIFFGN